MFNHSGGLTTAINAGSGTGDFLIYSANTFSLAGSGHSFSVTALTGYPQDTYLKAGVHSVGVADFPNSGTTQDVQVKTTAYDRVAIGNNNNVGSGSIPTIPENRRPLYWNGSELQAMTEADIDDTFIKPAILKLTGDTDPDYPRFHFTPYTIATSNSITDYVICKSSIGHEIVMRDHRADIGAFSANDIPEALDQPYTINDYFLLRWNGNTEGVRPLVCYDDGLRVMPDEFYTTYMVNRMAHYTRHVAGYRISYAWNTNYPGGITPIEEQNMGTLILNTKYTGSTYQVRKVNNDDYRAQEFPAYNSGEDANTAPTDSSWRLKILRY